MEPPSPSTLPSSKLSKQSINKAVKALLNWKKTHQSQTLNPSDEFLYLILTLIKPPISKTQPPISNNPHRIPLPNPLISPHSPTFHICLIVKDKFSLSSKDKIENELLPISNVIKISKFRSDYASFDAKKKLCDSYDAFFADKGLIPDLPKAIGRYFYKRKKAPIGIELGRSDWKEQIEAAVGSATLVFGTGSCSVMKAARASMGREKIVDNVFALAEGVAAIVPKKWRNVKGFHLKFTESLAMPIYGDGVSNGVGEGCDFDGGVSRENVEVVSDVIVGKKRKMELENVMKKMKQDDVFL